MTLGAPHPCHNLKETLCLGFYVCSLNFYLFLAALGLCCYVGFSPVAASRGRVSLQWLLLLRSAGSRLLRLQWGQLPALERRLSSCGAGA